MAPAERQRQRQRRKSQDGKRPENKEAGPRLCKRAAQQEQQQRWPARVVDGKGEVVGDGGTEDDWQLAGEVATLRGIFLFYAKCTKNIFKFISFFLK